MKLTLTWDNAVTLSGELYFVYSFTQASPPLDVIGVKHYMISVDDLDFEKLGKLRGKKVMVDSGGFRRLSKGIELGVEEVLNIQREVVEEIGALPVILDYPPRSWDEAYSSIKRTKENVRRWVREFGENFVYVVHGFKREHFEEALNMDVVPQVIALGGVAALSRHRPDAVIDRVKVLRELWDGKLHVLGAGNSLALALFLLGLADSADSSGHVKDARYWMVRDPNTMAMRKVKRGERCTCEFCKGTLLGSGGRDGLTKRALHNAYWLMKAMRSEELALRMVLRRKSLRKYFEGARVSAL